MAKVTKIEISNFKGISNISLALEDDNPPGRYVTLIGLNESGKTTVLEALSHSVLADAKTSELMETVQGPPELNDLIPKSSKAAFTDKITIKAFIKLDESDKAKIASFLLETHNYVLLKPIDTVQTVTREYTFEDSSFTKLMNLWSFTTRVKKKNGSKEYDLNHVSLRNEWVQTVFHIKDLLPQIIYFPTFLVDFPRRIYLEGNHGDVDDYYRQVIDDALCSLTPSLSISKHVIDRAAKHRTKSKGFSSVLRSSPEGQQIDATVQALASELNRVIFGAWSDIFGKKITGRRIHVEWHVDETPGRHIYIEISIVAENNVKFYVSERSLGFRWFFSFLLFTQFQSFRVARDKAIFLFDEPASHLHARAQQRLLKSFEKIAEPAHLIVYSTHSHYLINPLWLEKAYIVTNNAVNVDDDDPNDELSSKNTSIEITKYKHFVAINPTKTTYFQPALDALGYGIAPMTMTSPAVFLEGKFDYYPFHYLSKKLRGDEAPRTFPANGAGTMESLIALHRGWGVPFVILLDDDDAGQKEKKRYQKEFLLSDQEVVTIGDISPSLKGEELEAVFRADLRKLLPATASNPPNKHDFYLYFQALTTTSAKSPDIPETEKAFEELMAGLEARLAAQS